MKIRRAENKDKARLGELLSQVLEVHHSVRPDLFKSGAKKYTDSELDAILADENRPVFVAEESGKALGYAFCILVQHKDDNILTDVKTLYIDDLCVEPSCRRMGIAGMLMDKTKEYAKQKNCATDRMKQSIKQKIREKFNK